MDKPRGRPFQPGNKFGRGRPKGSRNKKSIAQNMLDQNAPLLIRKVMTEAMKGNASAMRLWMERISPRKGDDRVRLNLPSIRTMREIDDAAEEITKAIRQGKLTVLDADRLMSLLESRSRVIERTQFDARIEALERARDAEDARSATKIPSHTRRVEGRSDGDDSAGAPETREES